MSRRNCTKLSRFIIKRFLRVSFFPVIYFFSITPCTRLHVPVRTQWWTRHRVLKRVDGQAVPGQCQMTLLTKVAMTQQLELHPDCGYDVQRRRVDVNSWTAASDGRE